MVTEESEPSCPECGEPVGMRASYCMHCGAEFSSPVGANAVDEMEEFDGPDVSAVEDAISATLGGPDHESRSKPVAATGQTRGEMDTTDHGLLHPDSLLDNSLTVLVSVVAGLLIGIVALIAFGVTVGGYGILLAVVAWLGSTAVLARRRTVFDAVQDGAYAMALLFLTVPIAGAIADSGGVTPRLETFGVLLVPMGIFAAVSAGVGYLFGLNGVE